MGGKNKSKQTSQSQNVNNSQGVQSGVNMNYGVNQSGNFGFTNGGSQNTNASSNFGTSNSQGTSFGTSSGGSSNAASSSGSSQSTQDVWGQQSPYLQQVYDAASQGNADAQAAIQELTPGIQNQIGDLSQQGQAAFGQQLAGGAAGQLGPSQVAGMQGNSLQQQMLNNYNGQNPYLSGMKDQIANDANRLKQQNLGNLDARAAAAGMSGSSGYRNQVTDMNENVDDQALDAMTNLGYQSNSQAIQDRMRLSGAADQFNMQAAGAGDQYGMQQAAMMDQNTGNALGQTNALQQSAMNQFNPAMMGQQAAAMFGQTIGGPTVLGSSSSSNSSSSMGNSFSNSMNNSQNTANSLNTGSSFGQGTSFNNGMNAGFSNGMNVGMGMTGGVNAGSGFGTSTSDGSSSGWNIAPPKFSFA